MRTATETRLRGYANASTVGAIMGRAKDLIVKPISAQDANRIIKSLHYSGKVVNNSQMHLGVFMDGKCGGAMQFGPSLDKRKMLGLVEGALWNEFLELNRMAFADWLPRNGESRCIGYAMRWIRKTYPHIKWVVSFSDGTQCGDGTIYRASGFLLTGIKVNCELWDVPGYGKHHKMDFEYARPTPMQMKLRKELKMPAATVTKLMKAANAKPIPGFQLRYIYFLDPTARARLTVPILPFSEIDRRGAGMYKGKQRIQSRASSETIDTAGNLPDKGGETPTDALHSAEGAE
jgi:hypothetical protein